MRRFATPAAAALGVGALTQSEDAEAGFFTRGGKTLLEAWHGSPHKFDRFSTDHIGTGEGVAAYGHGLYFADDINIARLYQPRDLDNEAWMREQYKAAESDKEWDMMEAWERAMLHETPAELRESAADPDYPEATQAAFAKVADALENNPGLGSLSRVEIDVTPESLLDWDGPLSQQSEAVQAAANDYGLAGSFTPNGWLAKDWDDTHGSQVYDTLYRTFIKDGMGHGEAQRAASDTLGDYGAKGIQYLAPGGDSNYVIFDDNLVNIANGGRAKYAAPLAAATAGVLATTESEDAEAIFLGTGARNAPHDMLGMAKTMESRGVSRDEIWQKTGWGRGTDGFWRFEMDDRDMAYPKPEYIRKRRKPGGKNRGLYASYRDDDGTLMAKRPLGFDFDGKPLGWNFRPGRISSLTGGDELIDAYPALNEVRLTDTAVPEPALISGSAGGGSFSGVGSGFLYPEEGDIDWRTSIEPRWSDTIHQNVWAEPRAPGENVFHRPPELEVGEIYAAPGPDIGGADIMLNSALDQYQSTALHEMQHAIQTLEGWADGSPSGSGKKLANFASGFEGRLLMDGGYSSRDVDPLIDEYDKLGKRWHELDEQIGGDFENAPEELVEAYKKVDEEIEFLNLRYPYVAQASNARAYGQYDVRRGEGVSDYQAYKNVAGEVEARNVEARRNMTPQERRDNPPWKTADTPARDQVTIGNGPTPSGRSDNYFPIRERLVAENILGSTGTADYIDLKRSQDVSKYGRPGSLADSDAWALIQPQLDWSKEVLEDNLWNYFQFAGGTPEERSRLLLEAEGIDAANGNRRSPYTGFQGYEKSPSGGSKGSATVPGMAAAGAGGGVLATAYANLKSLYPESTIEAVDELGPGAQLAAMNLVTQGSAEGLVNDALLGGTLLTEAATGNDYEAPEVSDLRSLLPGDGSSQFGQFASAVGGRLAEGFTEDLGRLFDYKGIMGNMPSANEIVSGGIDWYQNNIAPYVNDRIEQAVGGTALLAGSLLFPRSSIRGAERKDYPGIYQDPDALLEQVEVEPETGVLEDVFGATRQDLADIGRTRQGNEAPALPGAAANPKGTAHGDKITKPANTGRLVNALENAMGTELEKGMSGWYVMDPLYEAYRALGLSEEEAARRFTDFQAFTGIHSSASDVKTELTRGTGALYLNEQGRMDDYVNYGGKVGQPGAPEDMSRFPGHFAHKTAHGTPLLNYIENGALTMKSPKVPLYIQSAGVPETGFQTAMPVGDAHFSRAIGLADVRPSKGKGATNESWTTPEAQQLTPWWRDEVAAQVDLESVPAQALAWGLYSPQTGVDTPVGVPKLEILAQMIADRAKERGISIEQARDEVLMGQDYVSNLAPK